MTTPDDPLTVAEELVAARALELLAGQEARTEALLGNLIEVVAHTRSVAGASDPVGRAVRATALLAAAVETVLATVDWWAEVTGVEPPGDLLDDVMAAAGELCDWAGDLTTALPGGGR